MISLRRDKQRLGFFRSYVQIGEWLTLHGTTGTYWAIPGNIKTLAGMKEIHVVELDEGEREIEMEGSYY